MWNVNKLQIHTQHLNPFSDGKPVKNALKWTNNLTHNTFLPIRICKQVDQRLVSIKTVWSLDPSEEGKRGDGVGGQCSAEGGSVMTMTTPTRLLRATPISAARPENCLDLVGFFWAHSRCGFGRTLKGRRQIFRSSADLKIWCVNLTCHNKTFVNFTLVLQELSNIFSCHVNNNLTRGKVLQNHQ